MPSTDPRPQSFARALVRTLAGTSGLAAVVALVASMLLADALIRAHVERGALAAAAVLVAELEEEPALVDEIEAEARELGIDARVAVVRGGQPLAGDAGLRPPSEAPCGVVDAAGASELVCVGRLAFDPAALVLVAVPAERAYGHRGALAIASALVLAVVLLVALVLAVTQARRLVAPIQALSRAVSTIGGTSQADRALPAASGFVEVDVLRDALVDLLARLDAELARTRRFAGDAAHELRTPLTKLSAELELARELPPTGAALDALLERLHRTTTHMSTLGQRLLLLATPAQGLDTGQGTSIAAVVEGLAERRPPAERDRLAVASGIPDGWVRGDPVLLAAVVDNLVDNALKFSTGPVRVDVRETATAVVIEVDDDGPGVPAEEKAAMFEPFHRGPSARSLPGHGLGLALVAHVVQAYGGRVEFVAERTRGACVRIELPARSIGAPPFAFGSCGAGHGC